MNAGQTEFLVDDEPAVVRALSRLLRAEGYETRAFGSPREFMDYYNPDAAGCLVLDLSMPEATGLDVQRWLASLGNPLPIIFLTATYDLPGELDRMMKKGVDVLKKPVNASVLIKGIEKALARDREARTAARP